MGQISDEILSYVITKQYCMDKSGASVHKYCLLVLPKMAVFPGIMICLKVVADPFAVRCDATVTWGFPDLRAGLPRPSLLFDGRRKKRLRSWREGRKRGTTTVGRRDGILL